LVSWENVDYLLVRPTQEYFGNSNSRDDHLSSDTNIKAPLPGVVAKIKVRQGELVEARQTLVVLEAMKMEHLITAAHESVVKRINCQEGDQVAKGDVIIELEPNDN